MTELDVAALRLRVREALDREWPGAQVSDIAPLHGGISSLTFTAAIAGAGRSDGAVVIKVAPPGLEPVRNRDVLRQARVMQAVHGVAGVAVPAVLACDDGSPPFFVMEFVAGEAYEPRWDSSPRPPAPAMVRARALAAARMLARLQAVEPASAGLAGEPVLSPGEELDRWARLYGTAGDELRGEEAALRDALAADVPPALPARILHGDYRLGNMQFAGEQLAAIIDWEIWSVGDPRCDLAWLMAFADPVMQRAPHRTAADRAAARAMPDGSALLAEYLREAVTPAPPPDLRWFEALCLYKLGATMAVLAKRNRRRPDPDPGLELAAQTTPPMLERARALLG